MHAPLRIEPDCPCLADEIAEPRPDMNIKVAAFTEAKSHVILGCTLLF